MTDANDLAGAPGAGESTDGVADAVTEKHPKLFIGMPAFGCLIAKQTLSSMLILRVVCAKNGIQTHIKMVGNESLITRGRNVITREFLASDCTHLLFIDADINFAAESVIDMLRFDKDVVTGIYAKKAYNWDKLATRDPKNIEPLSQVMLDFNINIIADTPVIDNRFIRVHDAATGFMMIKREIIEKVYEHYRKDLYCINDIPSSRQDTPDYVAVFDTMIDPRDHRMLSEDYAFCRRVQAVHGEVWTDLNCTLGHIGTFSFVSSDPRVVTNPFLEPTNV
jgi:hypothetical protein